MRRRHSDADAEQTKKRLATNGRRLPEPIGIGEILTDLTKTRWKIGNSIGVGGFGEIYLASDDISKPVGSESKYVIKVEPHDNGPLFVEMNFYLRAAKSELIDKWKKHFNLKHLGMPRFVGSGSHTYRGMRYRFLVLDRFGEDLSKLFLRNRKQFHIKTSFTLAIQILDILEYIHSQGYIHADIKASNLLLGRNNDKNQVYLLDYGLACHYLEINGNHKLYDSDERKAHRGTIEFTSRDAHIGALSRRGDLETLGYNLLQWLCGRLPWEQHCDSPELVHAQKEALAGDVPALLRACFPRARPPPPPALAAYLEYVTRLAFHARPDYGHCKRLLRQGIRDAGYADDDKLHFVDTDSVPKAKKAKKRAGKRRPPMDPENIFPKRAKVAVNTTLRQPCEVQNCNRMTRNSCATSPGLNWFQHQFSWEEVISSDPEKEFKRHSRPKSPLSRAAADEAITTPGYVRRTQDEVKVLTPAMIDVIARRWKQANVRSSKRKGKRESRCTSPVVMPCGYPTLEMDKVIKRNSECCQLEVRNSCATVNEVSSVLMLRSGRKRLNTPILNKQAIKPAVKKSRKTKIKSITTDRKGRKRLNTPILHKQAGACIEKVKKKKN